MASFRSLHALLRAPTFPARARARAIAITARATPTTRSYHPTAALGLPYKDDQDRQSVKPKGVEGGASATAEATADTDAAFDPSKTRPEEQHAAAEKQTGSSGGQDSSNPLDASGANPEDSPPVGKDGGPEMKEPVRDEGKKSSGHGSPQKKGKPPAGA